jgi:hypothetical protein
MAKPQGCQLPASIIEFAERYWELLSRSIASRMRELGVPKDMIGVKWPGVDEGAFVRPVLAHEFTEAPAPEGRDFHTHAVKHTANTPLRSTAHARQFLREYRRAEGY